MVSNLVQTKDVHCYSCFSPPYWIPTPFFRNTFLILFFKLFFFLALQLWHSFSIPSLMSYLLAGLEKDPHGDRVVTQQRQQASPYSSIHVYLWMSLTVSRVTQPCACKEQRGALPRAPTSARLCLGASMNLGLHYQHQWFLSKTTYSAPWQKVFVHIEIPTHRNVRENILLSFGEIRLPDSTKEATQQSSKLLCIQCFLCFVLPET